MMQRPQSTYISDPQLVPRVVKYLESNVNKTYVDITLMADELQDMYREYAKRKKSAFRAAVQKAYSVVLSKYGNDDQNESSSEELLDEQPNENERMNFLRNSLNNQMVTLYKRNQNSKIDENELIDISSDDSQDGSESKKTSNGPSTSNRENDNALPENSTNDFPKSGSVQGRKRKFEMHEPVSHKKRKTLATLMEPNVTFKDVAGIDGTLNEICDLLLHLKHPEVYHQIGITPPRGFLLHGPPGCGKTLLANAIAGELGIPLLKVAAPELVAGVSGESEERIRELFERVISSYPCVLFIDEIDAITPNRQLAQKDMERRIVAQLISCLDDLNQHQNGDKVILIGATNRPDSMDPALRRAGRFDREIKLGIPDEEARVAILKLLTKSLKLASDFDWRLIGTITPGYVGADLVSLTREAAMVAVKRMFHVLKNVPKSDQNGLTNMETIKNTENKLDKDEPEIIIDDDLTTEKQQCNDDAIIPTEPNVIIETAEDSCSMPSKSDERESEMTQQIIDETIEPNMTVVTLEDRLKMLHTTTPIDRKQLENLAITQNDFVEAATHIQPSSKREGFATVPDTTWNDVGSLKDIREELIMSILAPAKHKEHFKSLGLTAPAGVLLCGPPGCGKTLLAKAVANEAGINFISVKGPELLNMYVGESERAVRTCFERARNSAPCVIFFDELDALCPKRSESREGGATMRVVNQMLTEMDGIEGRNGVYLLAATNRPDIVDPAVLRPGRLDKILYVGLPSAPDRVEILKAITKNGTKPVLGHNVDLDEIGRSDELSGYTGADLAALVREASTIAFRDAMMQNSLNMNAIPVGAQHFQQAIVKIRPSVSEKDRKHYEKLRKLYTSFPRIEIEDMELP